MGQNVMSTWAWYGINQGGIIFSIQELYVNVKV